MFLLHNCISFWLNHILRNLKKLHSLYSIYSSMEKHLWGACYTQILLYLCVHLQCIFWFKMAVRRPLIHQTCSRTSPLKSKSRKLQKMGRYIGVYGSPYVKDIRVKYGKLEILRFARSSVFLQICIWLIYGVPLYFKIRKSCYTLSVFNYYTGMS